MGADYDDIRAQLREAEAEYRIATDYRSDPFLPLHQRAVWRRRARVAGRRVAALRAELAKQEQHA